MTEPTLQDVIRQATEKQQKEVGEKIIETQIKIITASYDKAVAYTNVIVVAGYAAFFGLWTLTKPHLSKPQALWAALFMCVSAATFVFFEVYKMAFTAQSLHSKYLTLSERLKGNTAQEVLAELQKLEDEGKKAALRFLPVWRICLLISVVTGLVGVGILAFAFVYALLCSVA
jgi:hypothetical protein